MKMIYKYLQLVIWCCPVIVFSQIHSTSYMQHGDEVNSKFCVPNTETFYSKFDQINGGNGVLSLIGKRVNKLPIKEGYIDRFSAVASETGTYLGYSMSSGGYSSSSICKLSIDAKTRLWCSDVPTFNLNFSVYRNAIYASGTGVVMKIDAGFGKVLWKHTHLYQVDTNFNVFRQAQFEGVQIKFFAQSGAKNPDTYTQLIIDDHSGKIQSFVWASPRAAAEIPEHQYQKSTCP